MNDPRKQIAFTHAAIYHLVIIISIFHHLAYFFTHLTSEFKKALAKCIRIVMQPGAVCNSNYASKQLVISY